VPSNATARSSPSEACQPHTYCQRHSGCFTGRTASIADGLVAGALVLPRERQRRRSLEPAHSCESSSRHAASPALRGGARDSRPSPAHPRPPRRAPPLAPLARRSCELQNSRTRLPRRRPSIKSAEDAAERWVHNRPHSLSARSSWCWSRIRPARRWRGTCGPSRASPSR